MVAECLGTGPHPRTARRLLTPLCPHGTTQTTALSAHSVSGTSGAATPCCWKQQVKAQGTIFSPYFQYYCLKIFNSN